MVGFLGLKLVTRIEARGDVAVEKLNGRGVELGFANFCWDFEERNLHNSL